MTTTDDRRKQAVSEAIVTNVGYKHLTNREIFSMTHAILAALDPWLLPKDSGDTIPEPKIVGEPLANLADHA